MRHGFVVLIALAILGTGCGGGGGGGGGGNGGGGPTFSLAFETQPPASSAAGAPFGLSVVVQDSSGAVSPGANGSISLSLAGGTGPLQGSTSASLVQGRATFSGLSINAAGTTYTLVASASGVTANNATSSTFTITPGPVSKLTVTNAPGGGPANVPIGTLSVRAEDAFANPIANLSVSVSLSSNPTGAVLGGTGSVSTGANGVATFSDLTIDRPGSYTLVATASGVSSSGQSVTISGFPTPSIAFAAGSSATANEAAGSFAVTVTLSIAGGLTQSAASVTVSDAATGTATSGTDYTAFAPVVVTFPAGTANGATQTVNVAVLADLLVEGDETVALALSAPSGANLGSQTSHAVTITEDDRATVAFSAATSATANEAAGNFNVAVRLTLPGGPLASAVTVNVTNPLTGTATSGTDYTALANPVVVTFPVGSANNATQNVAIPVLADLIVEGDETANLALSSPSTNAQLGAQTTHTATITDDDLATLAFASATSQTTNETAAAHNVAVRLTLPGGPLAVAVTVRVTDALTGTATSGTDYAAIPIPTTVTFPIGSTNNATQNVAIPVLQDALVEGNETVNLTLSTPSANAQLGGQTTHTATITDDDVPVIAFQAATSATANEAAGNHNVTVVLTLPGGPIGAPLTVQVVDQLTGSATSGTDYTALASPVTVTFATGSANGATQTVAIPVLTDLLVEGGETVRLQLQNPSAPAVLGAQQLHVATITDDDLATVAFSLATSATANEAAGNFNVAVRLTLPGGPLASSVTVNVTDALTGTATSGADYTALAVPVVVTFPVGSANNAVQNVAIPVLADSFVEGNETVNLGLSSPSTNAQLGAQTTHAATITDDDLATVAFQLATSATTNEAAGNFNVAVRLTLAAGTLGQAVTVNVTDALTGTATSGTDYMALANPVVVTFPVGSANNAVQNVAIPVLADTLVEGGETVNLGLSSPSANAQLGAQTTHQATITDDDQASVAFAAATSATANEAAGNHNVVVRLTLASGTLSQAVTVNVTDALTGTASSGTDYTALANPVVVTFPIGSANNATQNVAIPVLTDLIVEGNETVNLGLSNPSGNATLGAQTTHAATITDDDLATVAFATATSASANEAAGNINVAVRLTLPGGPLAQAVTVNVTNALTGTATSGTDYTALGNPVVVTFAIGSANNAMQNVAIPVLADTRIEGGETVNLSMSNPSANAQLGALTTHSATITDDDFATIAFQIPSSTADEGTGTLKVNVVLTYTGTLDVAVSANVADAGGGTATGSGTDYSFTTTGVSFPAATPSGTVSSVNVAIVQDVLAEVFETVNLALQSPSSAATLGQATHAVSILDEELQPEVLFEYPPAMIDQSAPCAANKRMVVVFSGPMDNAATSIGANSVRVNDGGGFHASTTNLITGNARLASSQDRRLLVVTPTGGALVTPFVRLFILGQTVSGDAVRDIAGNRISEIHSDAGFAALPSMGPAFQWTFAASDATVPVYVDRQPAPGATATGTTKVRLVFSEEIDPAVVLANFTVTDGSGARAGTILFDEDTMRGFTFTVSGVPLSGTVTVDARTIVDLAGNAVGGAIYSFTVGTDDDPPRITLLTLDAIPRHLNGDPLSGTVTVTLNSTTVTGASTAFTQELAPGDQVVFASDPNRPYTVQSVTSDTSLTLASNYLAATTAGVLANGAKVLFNADPLAAGTVSVTNGSATVSGTGTAFVTAPPGGDGLTVGNRVQIASQPGVFYLVNAATNTQLTLATAYTGTTNASTTLTTGGSHLGGILQVPPNGFTIDLTYEDPGGSGVSTNSANLTVTCNNTVSGQPAGTNLVPLFPGGNVTLTATNATLLVPGTLAFPAGANTITVTVRDVAGNARTRQFRFTVVTPTAIMLPLDASKNTDWNLFFDRDFDLQSRLDTVNYQVNLPPTDAVETDGIADFDSDLFGLGLRSASGSGNVTGVALSMNQAARNWVINRTIFYLYRHYGRATTDWNEEPGANRNPGFAAIRAFTTATTPRIQFFHNASPQAGQNNFGVGGLSANGFANGRAFYDPQNKAVEDNGTQAAGSQLGVFTGGLLFIFDGSPPSPFVKTRLLFDTLTPFRRTGDASTQLGVPLGTDANDPDILSPTQDPATFTGTKLTRYRTVLRAMDAVARFTAATLAHEIGHSIGLVDDDQPGAGHYGRCFNATAHHIDLRAYFPGAAQDVMSGSGDLTAKSEGATGFNELERAYLNHRIVVNPGDN